MLENAEILQRYNYVLFAETSSALYWKSPVGTTATLYKVGGWAHSGSDTVQGMTGLALYDRLLKYHHKLVPREE